MHISYIKNKISLDLKTEDGNEVCVNEDNYTLSSKSIMEKTHSIFELVRSIVNNFDEKSELVIVTQEGVVITSYDSAEHNISLQYLKGLNKYTVQMNILANTNVFNVLEMLMSLSESLSEIRG